MIVGILALEGRQYNYIVNEIRKGIPYDIESFIRFRILSSDKDMRGGYLDGCDFVIQTFDYKHLMPIEVVDYLEIKMKHLEIPMMSTDVFIRYVLEQIKGLEKARNDWQIRNSIQRHMKKNEHRKNETKQVSGGGIPECDHDQ